MEQVPITDARDDLAEIVNRAAYKDARTVLTRHGKRLAAIVPLRDLRLLEYLEDQADLRAIHAALADPANATPVPLDDFLAELAAEDAKKPQT